MESTIVRPKSKGSFSLWFPVLGPPLLWATQLVIGGELPEVACASGYQPNNLLGLGIRTFLVIASVVLGLPVLAGAVISFRNLRVLSRIEHRDEREERGHFMALVGLVASLFFLVVIIVSGIAIFIFAVCQRT